MRGGGAIRIAGLRRGSGHQSAQAVPPPPDIRAGGHATALWRGPTPWLRGCGGTRLCGDGRLRGGCGSGSSGGGSGSSGRGSGGNGSVGGSCGSEGRARWHGRHEGGVVVRAVGMGGAGRAAGGAVGEGGVGSVPYGVEGTAQAGLVEGSEVVRFAHAAWLSHRGEPVGRNGSSRFLSVLVDGLYGWFWLCCLVGFDYSPSAGSCTIEPEDELQIRHDNNPAWGTKTYAGRILSHPAWLQALIARAVWRPTMTDRILMDEREGVTCAQPLAILRIRTGLRVSSQSGQSSADPCIHTCPIMHVHPGQPCCSSKQRRQTPRDQHCGA